MRWLASWAALGAYALVNAAACSSQQCTEIGCSSGVELRVAPEGNVWQRGSYSVQVSLDGDTSTCDFSIPEDLPERGSVTSLECGMLQQLAACTEVRQGDGVSHSCEPIPDQYELTLDAFAEPANLSLTLRRDGNVLLSHEETLSYRDTFPNGPECGSRCRRASLDLSFDGT
jgi:hypothetical protein